MKRFKNIWVYFITVSVAFCCCIGNLYATSYNTSNGIADLGDGSGTITITPNANQSLVGKRFNVYKLFTVISSDTTDSVNYVINSDYAYVLKKLVADKAGVEEVEVTANDVVEYIRGLGTGNPTEGSYSDFRMFVETLRDRLNSAGKTGDVVTVDDVKSDGSFQITGLEYGYYIVDETTGNRGQHQASSLCMVSTVNPSTEIRIKSDYPSIIKKIKEDDNGVGWNDIGDYEIGQKVPFKYETYVPNMNGYNTYYFAMHDKMDDALTFDSSSVKIVITNGTKSYTVSNDEMIISENVGEDTFKIEISDLKAIVDREFPEGMNSQNENIYGQDIIVTYNAVLNDSAAEDTGRPGFENSVKLEFSNDPDSSGASKTGETPWDTVVCFTYKLNGLKTNDNNEVLKGVKFRLYSDKDCTNEVYVKATANGYNVINRDTAGNTKPSDSVEMVSNDKGGFVVYGLDGGTYWLKETSAPDGYTLLEKPIEIKVVPTFTDDRNSYVAGEGATNKILKDLKVTTKIGNTSSDLVTDVEDGSSNITVVNKVGTLLPSTGSSVTLGILVTGALLMGYAVVRSRKKSN